MAGSSLSNWDGRLSTQDQQQIQTGITPNSPDGVPTMVNHSNNIANEAIQRDTSAHQRVFVGLQDEGRVRRRGGGTGPEHDGYLTKVRVHIMLSISSFFNEFYFTA